MIEVKECKKKVDAYCTTTERLEADVERRTKELKDLRKNPEAKALRSDVHRLVNDLATTRSRAQEKVDKLQKEIEKKIDQINSYIQQMSWEESLAKKNDELGVFE
ncbi:Uncharacterized protein Fot_07988 [Forsythia ovata]|uniref:Uncharacterized protein n=1 Tax=Forsythia ovata TaxID=205694 RepID=A0ABD1WXD2_9LAMI